MNFKDEKINLIPPNTSALTDVSDEALAMRYLQSKREDDLAELVKRHRQFAYRLAYGHCGRETLADDAVQEAFLWLLNCDAECNFTKPGSFRAWFAKVVINTARMTWRCEQQARRRAARGGALRKETNAQTEVGTLAQKDQKELINAAVSALKKELRLPIMLHYLEGLPQSEVGKIMGVSQVCVSHRLKQGLALLRKSLEKQGAALPAAGLLPLLQTHLVLTTTASTTEFLSQLQAKNVAGTFGQSSLAAKPFGWATKIAAGIVFAGVAGGLFYHAFFNDKQIAGNDSPSSALESNQEPDSGSGDYSLVYLDDFDGDKISDFWELIEPPDKVSLSKIALNETDSFSALVLKASGATAKQLSENQFANHTRVLSRPIPWPNEILEIVAVDYDVDITDVNRKILGATQGIIVVDETEKTIDMIVPDKNFFSVDSKSVISSKNRKMVYGIRNINDAPQDHRNRSRFFFFPDGVLRIEKNDMVVWGFIRTIPKSFRICFYLTVKNSTAKASWSVDNIVIRRHKSTPLDLVEEHEEVRNSWRKLENKTGATK